jgi:hypothetical protein
MRVMLLVLQVVLASALMVSMVAAQQRPLPPSDAATQGMVRPQAPVGHRQPKMNDLPPDLAQKESGEANKAQRDDDRQNRQNAIDNDRKICRGC